MIKDVWVFDNFSGISHSLSIFNFFYEKAFAFDLLHPLVLDAPFKRGLTVSHRGIKFLSGLRQAPFEGAV